jgi:queuine tRNA-ribosyltransferase
MAYHLVQHRNGSTSVACADNDEIMHPSVGPEIESRTLYVEGLRLAEELALNGRLRVWDVGMGAAANALSAIEALSPLPGRVDLLSFDHTSDALRFASNHAEHFPSIARHQDAVDELLNSGTASFGNVHWRYIESDFPKWLTAGHAEAPPDAILFDAWSPRANPGMWTFELFQQLRQRVSERAALATYSRATCIRSALLLAGFHVGRGPATGAKEETTVAATCLDMLRDPLPKQWLLKAERSHSGRPFLTNVFEKAPLSDDQLKQLHAHPQFR